MDNDKEQWIVEIGADTTPLRNELASTARIGRQFAASLASAFDGIAFKGRGLGDVLRGLASQLSRMVLTDAFKPLESVVNNAVSGLLSGGLLSGNLISGFARGGVLHHGTPVPFAKGGVIAAPMTFPLADGRAGIAGERGAEAIMPLTRGPDGRLGVASHGSGGVSITFNVTATDAESFRRTEGQIAAMLSRAVGRGQRNL